MAAEPEGTVSILDMVAPFRMEAESENALVKALEKPLKKALYTSMAACHCDPFFFLYVFDVLSCLSTKLTLLPVRSGVAVLPAFPQALRA